MDVLKEEFNSTSSTTYVPPQLTKDKLLLRHIDTFTKSNIKIDKLDLFGKKLESSFSHTLNFCPDLVKYRFKNMYLKKQLTQSSTVIFLSTN